MWGGGGGGGKRNLNTFTTYAKSIHLQNVLHLILGFTKLMLCNIISNK